MPYAQSEGTTEATTAPSLILDSYDLIDDLSKSIKSFPIRITPPSIGGSLHQMQCDVDSGGVNS